MEVLGRECKDGIMVPRPAQGGEASFLASLLEMEKEGLKAMALTWLVDREKGSQK